MMKSLKLPLVLLALVLAQSADANPLYSWTTKDGTPTYSPDPPPKGVSYEIVGADLQPLQDEPSASAQATPAAAVASNTSDEIATTPVPDNPTSAQSSQPKTPWKPVVYANDPNPQTSKREPGIAAALPAPEATPVKRISEQCLELRQQLALLESQFANAFSAKQMDDAVVRLHNFKKQNEGACSR